MLFSTLFAMVSVASVASAQLTPGTLLQLPTNQLLNGLAELGSQAAIDLGVVANVLGPQGCTPTQVVGVDSTIILDPLTGNPLPLAEVCVCVDVIPAPNTQACPACPINADTVCSTQTACACACRDGFVASPDAGCVRVAVCGENFTTNADNTCSCNAPFTLSTTGTCVLGASPLARRSNKISRGARNEAFIF